MDKHGNEEETSRYLIGAVQGFMLGNGGDWVTQSPELGPCVYNRVPIWDGVTKVRL